MAELLDNCRFTAGSSGTADFADGTATPSFRNLEDAGAVNGVKYPYKAMNVTGTEWEFGRGTAIDTGGVWTFDRTDIEDSSNGGAAVNFTTNPVVIITAGADELRKNFVLPSQFGAVGDGVSDDSTALQAAIDAAVVLRLPLSLEGKTYRVVTKLIPSGGLSIEGPGTFVNDTTNDYILQATGTSESSINLSGNAAAGDVTLSLAAVTNIVAGDWLYLSSSKTWASTGGVTFGEWVKIVSVDGGTNTVTLYAPILHAYATADSALINRIVFREGFHFENFNIVGSGSGTQKAILLTRCRDITLKSIRSRRCNERHVQLARCLDFDVADCRFEDSQTNGLSYGLALVDGCANGTVARVRGDDLRHTVTLGGANGVNRSIIVCDSISVNSRDAGFDQHPGCQGVTFRNLTVFGAGTSVDGVVVQGIDGVVDGVTAYGIDRYVVLCQNLTAVSGSAIVKSVQGDAGNAVVFVDANSGDFNGLVVDDVVGSGASYLCLVQAGAGRTIKGVSVNSLKSRAALGGRGLRLFANGSAALIDDAAISNCRIEMSGTGSNTEAIYLHGNTGVVSHVSLTGNRTINGSFGLRGVGSDYVSTDGTNMFTGAGTSNLTVAGSNNRFRDDIGTNVTLLRNNTAATLAAGFDVTPFNAGTKSSGTYTPAPADGNMQRAINGGAHTLAPPATDCNIVVQYTNNGSAGAITTSGFTQVLGAPTTVNGDDFFAFITRINGFSCLMWVALQ